MLLPKQLDPKECKVLVRNVNGTDVPDMKKFFSKSSCIDLIDWFFKIKLKRYKLQLLKPRLILYILVYSDMNVIFSIGNLVLRIENQNTLTTVKILLLKMVLNN